MIRSGGSKNEALPFALIERRGYSPAFLVSENGIEYYLSDRE